MRRALQQLHHLLRPRQRPLRRLPLPRLLRRLGPNLPQHPPHHLSTPQPNPRPLRPSRQPNHQIQRVPIAARQPLHPRVRHLRLGPRLQLRHLKQPRDEQADVVPVRGRLGEPDRVAEHVVGARRVAHVRADVLELHLDAADLGADGLGAHAHAVAGLVHEGVLLSVEVGGDEDAAAGVVEEGGELGVGGCGCECGDFWWGGGFC